MRIAYIVLINALAPLLAIAVSIAALRPDLFSGDPAAALSGAARCAIDSGLTFRMDCDAPIGFGWLFLGGVATLVLVMMVLIVNRIAAIILGSNRDLLAAGFTPYAFANIPAILGVSLANIGLVGATASLSAHHWFNTDAVWLIVFLAFAAAGLIWVMIGQGLAFFRAPKMFVPARPIQLGDQPRLGLLIRDVAQRTQARMPDNVLLGLEPTFYATNAPVMTPYGKTPLKGQTLHLSLPLMSLFSTGELRAVVGHELGHFSGKDTIYSMRFAPALASMHGAVHRVRDQAQSFAGVFLMPAQLLLEDFVHVFGSVHGRISRQRETRADQMGAAASCPEDVAYSLLKATVGGSVWQSTLEGLLARARMGRFSRNVVRSFVDQMRLDLDREKLPPSIVNALAQSVPHPTDAHPTTDARIAQLGLVLPEVLDDDRVLNKFFAGERAHDGLDQLAPVEEDLTTLYYHMLQQQWAPVSPKEKDAEEIYLSLMADFLARMTLADGRADDPEILMAEDTAARLFGNFDRDGFRERCRHPEDLPELDPMIEFANRLLTPTGAENLRTALRAVAEANGSVAASEIAMLQSIDAKLRPKGEAGA